MVVFTCNHCGDSLQKPKVAKHYQFQCRTTEFLTCVDCFKDFRGNEYTTHTKCITENERYGGKDYVIKQSANKGEKKQQAWLNIVQNVLNNSKDLSGPEKSMLMSISKHENIPRKKAKFMNFMKNVSGFRVNVSVAERVWNKMENAFKDATAESAVQQEKQNGSTGQNQKNLNHTAEGNVHESSLTINGNHEGESKKAKKRKHQSEENDSNEPASKVQIEEETVKALDETISEKFSWKNSIVEIVKLKGEISMKKLRKKVVAKYLAEFPAGTHEKAISKFEKKLGKVTSVVIEDNIVKLVNS